MKKTYRIIINGKEYGKQDLTPEQVKKYSKAGIIAIRA